MRKPRFALDGWVLVAAFVALTVGCGDDGSGGSGTEATGGSSRVVGGRSGNAGVASGGGSKGGTAPTSGGSSGVGGGNSESTSAGLTTTGGNTSAGGNMSTGGGFINVGGAAPGGGGLSIAGSSGAGTGSTAGYPTSGGTPSAGSSATGGAAATGGSITGTGGTSAATTASHTQGVISGGAHWPAGTHNVSGTITIESGVLELDACSTIRMASGARIVVGTGGALRLIGTQTCYITVTSTNSSPAPGDWRNLEFLGSSDKARNVLDWVIIEYGGSGSVASLSLQAGAGVRITNTTVRNSAYYGVMAEKGSELITFSGNRIVDNHLNPIALAANQVSALDTGVYGPNQVEGVNVSEGYELNADATWPNLGVPYLLPDGLMLDGMDSSANLTIEAGSTMKLGRGKSVIVASKASLTLDGTANAHVTITSAAANPAAGDWNVIELYPSSSSKHNTFSFADIMFGGRNGAGQVWLEDGTVLTLANVVFSASGTANCDIWKGSDSTVTVTSGASPRTCE